MIWRIGTLAIVGITFGTLGMFMADRTPPTIVYAVDVLTPQVPPGGQLKVEYTVNRARSCATNVERILFDAQRVRVPLEDMEFKAAPGPMGPDKYISAVSIPTGFARGEAKYRVLTTYRCNPIHALWPITVLTADVSFDVTGP